MLERKADRIAELALGALLFGAHGAGAAVAFRLLAQSFPLDHPRFWSNTVAPLVLVGVGLAGVVGALLGRVTLVRGLALAVATTWAAGALVAALVYPVSLLGARTVLVALGAGAFAAVLALARPRLERRASVGALLGGSGLALVLVLAQRAPDPDTKPAGPGDAGALPLALAILGRSPRTGPPPETLGATVRLDARQATVAVVASRVSLELSPLLTFESRSPDRAWTLFAPWPASFGAHRRLVDWEAREDRATFAYEDDGRSRLDIRRETDGVSLDATSTLDAPVYSHLNASLVLVSSGHSRLAVSFSPCPTPISIEPSDYPVGRPERIAYRDARGFHVVEASSGEKGPFRTLAEGPLAREEPLVLTFQDDGRPVLEVSVLDWSRQAGEQLSPTAGWGLPVNAIEMRRTGDDPSAPCVLDFALAASSVGRGWDAVGHAAGTYLDRVRVRRLP